MHLQRLVRSWGLLADLSFSDLLLFGRSEPNPGKLVLLGHVRPTTAQTIYRTDLVGGLFSEADRPIATQVWGDRLAVVAPDHKADAWFSEVVGLEVVLAWFPPTVVRPLDPAYARHGGRTGFADGFPFLVIGEASLADLNARLAIPLPMNRFRPNLVVAGSAPWAEDGWGNITVGGIPMEVVKHCARCVVTTTDQATGKRMGDEPLRTLATFRRHERGVMFGQNVVHYGTGMLRVGDAVVPGG